MGPDTLIEDDAHLEAAISMARTEPVRAGIVERPTDWPW
jgi:hypothetical protein